MAAGRAECIGVGRVGFYGIRRLRISYRKQRWLEYFAHVDAKNQVIEIKHVMPIYEDTRKAKKWGPQI